MTHRSMSERSYHRATSRSLLIKVCNLNMFFFSLCCFKKVMFETYFNQDNFSAVQRTYVSLQVTGQLGLPVDDQQKQTTGQDNQDVEN